MRFKAFKKWLGCFPRRWGLTGSPASNGLIDLFGQVYVLDKGRRLGQYITHYRYQYFYPTGFGGYQYALQDGAEKRIYKKLKDLALSMKAEDHLDLPQLVERDIYVTLPSKAGTLYRQIEEDFFALYDKDVVVAANAAVASGKCRQVASGGIYVERSNKKRVTRFIHNEKTEALVDLVDELQGAPLLVGYEFQHDLERIREALGKNTPAISGSMGDRELIRVVDKWNDGKIPVLCAHPAAAGHGLNLQGSSCSHVCWYSPTWDFELYDQFIRRVWRQGTKASRTIVHRIIAHNTLDEVVIKALRSKQRRQDALMSALKKYRSSRVL